MLDEGLDLITQLWSGEPVSYQGQHYTAKAAALRPTPLQQPRVPVWIGGESRAAFRRAARWDGWMIGTVDENGQVTRPPERIARQTATLRSLRTAAGPFDVAVDGLTAPSVDGEFGVLPGHRPLLAALKTGIVSYDKEGEHVALAVGPGFVEVSEDKALLLTDSFIKKEDVDPVQTRLDLKEADEALEQFAGEPGSSEHAELIIKELWAAVKLELYGDPPPPTLRTFHEFQLASREDYVKALQAARQGTEGGAAEGSERD
jgi:ATP synthase F1 epsilon subunit